MIYYLCMMIVFLGVSISSMADTATDYQAAVRNAALHRLPPPTSSLITLNGKHARLVYYANEGDVFTVGSQTLPNDLWVSVSPEVKRLCRQYAKHHAGSLTHQQLSLWIAELLGLPADYAKHGRFVELDVPVIQAYYGSPVSTIGIFRPCPDPRVGKHTDGSPICPKKMNPADVNISSTFKTWFINNALSSYSQQDGFPWTGYGYTYHWGSGLKGEGGVSEFVVLKGTRVVVRPNVSDRSTPYSSVEQYCLGA